MCVSELIQNNELRLVFTKCDDFSFLHFAARLKELRLEEQFHIEISNRFRGYPC